MLNSPSSRTPHSGKKRSFLLHWVCCTLVAGGWVSQELTHSAIAATTAFPGEPVLEELDMPSSARKTSDLITQSDLTTEMDAYLQAHHELGRFLGSVIVVRDGETVFAKGYGMASLEHQVTNSPQTKFRIGSVTKQFTAAAILQLQDRGQLDVQESVATYLPEYPNGDRITLHHLLTHTAGIPNLTSFPDYVEWMRLPTTLEGQIARFQDMPLEFEPGAQYRYSNSGYILLTQIIETVSDQSYDQYLKDHLFQPLGMENTGYELPLAVINGLASGYQFTGESYQQAEYINMAVPQGAGGLYSTVADLARWHQFLFDAEKRDEAVLSDEAIAAMTFPHVVMDEDTPDLSSGYGFVISDRGENRYIAHGGGINGFVTNLGSIPNLGITIAVLSNVETADPAWISEDLTAILLGQPYEMPIQPEVVMIDPTLYDRYVGTYELTPEFQVTVTDESGQLQIQGTGQPPVPLYPASETEFFAKVIDFRIVFNSTTDGVVESLTLFQNGQELTALKVN